MGQGRFVLSRGGKCDARGTGNKSTDGPGEGKSGFVGGELNGAVDDGPIGGFVDRDVANGTLDVGLWRCGSIE